MLALLTVCDMSVLATPLPQSPNIRLEQALARAAAANTSLSWGVSPVCKAHDSAIVPLLPATHGRMPREATAEPPTSTVAPYVHTVRIPLPQNGSAEYIVRASGAALVLGHVRTARRSNVATLTHGMTVLRSRAGAEPTTRFAEVGLPLPGTYEVEVMRIFNEFDATQPLQNCVDPHDLVEPFFLGRISVGPQRYAGRPAATSLWVPGPSGAGPVSTRVQLCAARPFIPKKKLLGYQDAEGFFVKELKPSTDFLGRLDSYVWRDEFAEPTAAEVEALRSAAAATGLCMIGSSHVRSLAFTYAEKFGKATYMARSFPEDDLIQTGPFAFVRLVYNNQTVQKHIGFTGAVQKHTGFTYRSVQLERCPMFVVSFGQWDLGHNCGYPTDLAAFEARLLTMVEALQTSYPAAPVVLVSESYNPLGCLASACPALDWRVPPLTRALNAAMRAVCRNIGPPLLCLDTSDIQAPMWDGAPDWSHPTSKVVAQIVNRIARVAIRTLVRGNLTV